MHALVNTETNTCSLVSVVPSGLVHATAVQHRGCVRASPYSEKNACSLVSVVPSGRPPTYTLAGCSVCPAAASSEFLGSAKAMFSVRSPILQGTVQIRSLLLCSKGNLLLKLESHMLLLPCTHAPLCCSWTRAACNACRLLPCFRPLLSSSTQCVCALEVGGAEDLLRVVGSRMIVEDCKAKAPVLPVKVLGHEQLGLCHACAQAAVPGEGWSMEVISCPSPQHAAVLVPCPDRPQGRRLSPVRCTQGWNAATAVCMAKSPHL